MTLDLCKVWRYIKYFYSMNFWHYYFNVICWQMNIWDAVVEHLSVEKPSIEVNLMDFLLFAICEWVVLCIKLSSECNLYAVTLITNLQIYCPTCRLFDGILLEITSIHNLIYMKIPMQFQFTFFFFQLKHFRNFFRFNSIKIVYFLFLHERE